MGLPTHYHRIHSDAPRTKFRRDQYVVLVLIVILTNDNSNVVDLVRGYGVPPPANFVRIPSARLVAGGYCCAVFLDIGTCVAAPALVLELRPKIRIICTISLA